MRIALTICCNRYSDYAFAPKVLLLLVHQCIHSKDVITLC